MTDLTMTCDECRQSIRWTGHGWEHSVLPDVPHEADVLVVWWTGDTEPVTG